MHGSFLCLDPIVSIVDFPVSESLAVDALDAACFTKLFYLALNCSFCDTYSLSAISTIVILGLATTSSRILYAIPTSKPTLCRFGDLG